jgi:hypothetical protein
MLRTKRCNQMFFNDFYGNYETNDAADSEAMLIKLLQLEENNVSISLTPGGFPWLNILLRNNAVVIHYFPEEFDAGFISYNPNCQSSQNEGTCFLMDSEGQEHILANCHIISLREAIVVANEFIASQTRSEAVYWFKL